MHVPSDCVLSQYAPGLQDGYPVRGYRDEDDVPPNSTTPTFVAVKLRLANWRWASVSLYLRTGNGFIRHTVNDGAFNCTFIGLQE